MHDHVRPLWGGLSDIVSADYVPTTAGALYSLKLKLLGEHSPAEVAESFAVALGGGGVEILPFSDLATFSRAHALRLENFVPHGSVQVTMPRVHGIGRADPITVNGRWLYSALLDDAVVVGRSSLVKAGGYLLGDFSPEELAALPVDFRFDPQLFNLEDKVATVFRAATPSLQLEQAINLVGVTSCAYGHWMLEYLPKLLQLRAQGLAAGCPILIDEAMPWQHREALNVYVAGEHPIIEVPAFATVHVSRLWCVATLCFVPMMPTGSAVLGPTHLSPSPAILERLFSGQLRHMPAVPAGSARRLVLARRMSLHRRLTNSEAIFELSRSFGFDVVYPEEHSFEQQLDFIRHASFIIAPEGSAVITALHARPGTRLLILNHPFLENLPALTEALERGGIDMQIIQGRCVRLDEFYRKFSDYEIDPDGIRDILIEWRLEAGRGV